MFHLPKNAPAKVQVRLSLIIAAAIDCAAAKQVAHAPVRPEQDGWDAIDATRECAHAQAGMYQRPIPHDALSTLFGGLGGAENAKQALPLGSTLGQSNSCVRRRSWS